MKKVIKQVLGIDVAQLELVVCLGRMYDTSQKELYGYKTFANTAKGFELLLSWTRKLTQKDVDVLYVMEATGVYHERLAYFLKDHDQLVSIVVPNKISNYAKSLTIKTVTDKTASEAISQFGLDRMLDQWEKPLPVYKKIKQLTRERDQIVTECTLIKNQLHAEKSEAEPNKNSISRIKKRIELMDKQQSAIMLEIKELVKSNQKVTEMITIACSIPGVGLLTAATILAETSGFDLINSRRQLTSFAGLDVKEKQSGKSIKGKPKISKSGNRYLRKAMHMPSLSIIRHDENSKNVFSRILVRHGIKMKALVAIQRKTLELVYTLCKNKTKYDKEYIKGFETANV